MYEIRIYRKNDDKHIKDVITWHVFNFFDNYDDTYNDFIWLMNHYKEIEVDNVVFNPSVPMDTIEAYTLFLDKKGKELATIVKRDNIKAQHQPILKNIQEEEF